MSNREENRKRITEIFSEIGTNYMVRGIVIGSEIHQNHDTHAFYRIAKDPSKVVHVQGYLGLSSEENMIVVARLMDYGIMMATRVERRHDHSVIGNEGEAALTNAFSNMI